MALRMLGVFMILPIFALEAPKFPGANEALIGLAIGIYGLTQAALQIPFGILSDIYSRKKIIILGLSIFALGSLIAAAADNIHMLILGRALQGAGAIGSAVMAYVADSTRDIVRARAMAFMGMSIGASFGLAMVIGPLLNNIFGLSGLFLVTASLAIAAITALCFNSPTVNTQSANILSNNLIQNFKAVIFNKNLFELDLSVFTLHAVLAALFLVIPVTLQSLLPESIKVSWVYFGILLVAFGVSFNIISIFEKLQKLESLRFTSFVAIAISLFLLFCFKSTLFGILSILLGFFIAFCILEASLPSVLSRIAPTDCRGMALGVFSTSQFLGIFIGGMLGGIIHNSYGSRMVIGFCLILVSCWILLFSCVKISNSKNIVKCVSK